MNIEQLESMLEHVSRMMDIANDSNLGMDQIKDDLDNLQSSIEGALMILVYEKYKEEREID